MTTLSVVSKLNTFSMIHCPESNELMANSEQPINNVLC